LLEANIHHDGTSVKFAQQTAYPKSQHKLAVHLRRSDHCSCGKCAAQLAGKEPAILGLQASITMSTDAHKARFQFVRNAMMKDPPQQQTTS
jgi:hypothetical protein